MDIDENESSQWETTEEEEEGEEAGVICRIPVFLSHDWMMHGPTRYHGLRGSNRQLQVWQYPARPRSRPYRITHPNVRECRVRKRYRRVELDFEMERDETYGEHAEVPLDHLTLRSKHIPSLQSYAVGYLHRGEFHITPLHSLLSFHPTFDHTLPSELASALGIHAQSSSSSSTLLTPATTQKLARSGLGSVLESELAERSFEYAREQERRDPFEVFSSYPDDSLESQIVKDKLRYNDTSGSQTLSGHPSEFFGTSGSSSGAIHSSSAIPPRFSSSVLEQSDTSTSVGFAEDLQPRMNVSRKDYYDVLFPVQSDSVIASNNSSLRSSSIHQRSNNSLGGIMNRSMNVESSRVCATKLRYLSDPSSTYVMTRPPFLSRERLRSGMSVREQVLVLFNEARVVRFSTLMDVCVFDDVVRFLQEVRQIACLVRSSSFVLRSEYVFPDAPYLIEVRDLILSHLHFVGFVRRSEIAVLVPDVAADHITLMLGEFATLDRSAHAWKLRSEVGEEDSTFCLSDSQASIISEEEEFWTIRRKELERSLARGIRNVTVEDVNERILKGSYPFRFHMDVSAVAKSGGFDGYVRSASHASSSMLASRSKSSARQVHFDDSRRNKERITAFTHELFNMYKAFSVEYLVKQIALASRACETNPIFAERWPRSASESVVREILEDMGIQYGRGLYLSKREAVDERSVLHGQVENKSLYLLAISEVASYGKTWTRGDLLNELTDLMLQKHKVDPVRRPIVEKFMDMFISDYFVPTGKQNRQWKALEDPVSGFRYFDV